VNRVTRPFSTRAHLQCVPGSTISDRAARDGSSAIAPMICASSPRITSGNGSSCMTPGTRCTRPQSDMKRTMPEAIVAVSAGQATYGTTCHPVRLPTMPAAHTGTPGPRSSQSAAMPRNAAA
jgi:hypothetical protein